MQHKRKENTTAYRKYNKYAGKIQQNTETYSNNTRKIQQNTEKYTNNKRNICYFTDAFFLACLLCFLVVCCISPAVLLGLFGENARTYRKRHQTCTQNATTYRKAQQNCRKNATTYRKVQQNCRENIILPTPVSWMFDVFSVFCCVFPAVLRGVVSGHDVSFPGRRRIAREPPLPSITCSFAHFRGKCNRIPQGKCRERAKKRQKRRGNAAKYPQHTSNLRPKYVS